LISLPSIDPVPIHEALLGWYREQGRDLPWRHTRDPYAILVAEIMLQQTQVERVIPKYHEFLTAFPTFAALAAAPAEAVIRAWSGLGYNQRAVRLQGVARAVMADHGGQMPQTLAGLLALPGIGRYTAGALACFALGQAVAEAALPAEPERAYDWNQALMDLGATVCLARAPACDRCPLAAQCHTFAQLRERTLFPSGAELPALRVADAPASYTAKPRPAKPSQPFKESSRYFRGRVVAALRTVPAGASLALEEIGPQVKADFGVDDAPWLRGIVAGLVRDGLAAWADAARTRVALPQ
jgi:A/G-specific adenine glycosylase